MRATAIILGLIFSTLLMLFGGTIGPLIGGMGFLASLALWIHRQVGFVLLLVPVLLAVIAAITNGPGFLFEASVYGLLAFIAYRVVQRHQRNEARAARMDRYVRQQLGE